MISELKLKADLMAENFYALKQDLKWENTLAKHFAAITCTTKGKKINTERVKEIKAFIKSETRWTSYFRGVNEFMISNLIYFEEDYRGFFNNMQMIYEKMRKSDFKNSVYLPMAAYTIAKEVPLGDWQYRIDRARDYYNSMRKNHYWLTSADDYVFAVVLAATDLDVNQTSIKIEECYSFLNQRGFYKGNDLQTLSHILALGEENVEEKCSKAVDIHNKLRKIGCKLEYKGLATLGVLSLITNDIDKIVGEIKEVYDYIYEKDGYGFWNLDKGTRTILSATLVSDYYVDEIKKGVLQVTLANSINAIIIAQQQAAIAAACAASSAAAASASS